MRKRFKAIVELISVASSVFATTRETVAEHEILTLPESKKRFLIGQKVR
jgi:hypothetical protein